MLLKLWQYIATMASEIITDMLEVPSGFGVSGLIVVEQGAIEAAKRYVELCAAFYNDPQTLQVNITARVEGRARHRANSELGLVVMRRTLEHNPPRRLLRKKPASRIWEDVIEMTVERPDGDMKLAIDFSKPSLPNLAEDPYAEHVMGVFRSHLAAA